MKSMSLEDKAVQLHKVGKTDAEISSRLGVEERIVHRWVSSVAAPVSFFGRGAFDTRATDRAALHRALDAVMDRAETRSAGKDAGLNIASKVTRDATICHKCGQIVRCKEGCFKPHSIPGPNNGQTCSGTYKVVGTECWKRRV